MKGKRRLAERAILSLVLVCAVHLLLARSEASEVTFIQATTHPKTDQEPAWSPDGKKIAFQSDRSGSWDIWVMDMDGNKVNLTSHPATDLGPAWSPDGRKIAFASTRGEGDDLDIYVMDANGTNVKPLAGFSAAPASAGWDAQPAWSPDGEEMVWGRGISEIWIMDSDGSNQEKLVSGMGNLYEPQWSPDGKYVYFKSDKGHYAQFEVWRVRVGRTKEPEQITKDGNNHGCFRFNPANPSKVAVMLDIGGKSNDKKNLEIYIMNSDGSNPQNISNHPAWDLKPTWSPDGTRIAFWSTRSGNDDIWVAVVPRGAPKPPGSKFEPPRIKPARTCTISGLVTGQRQHAKLIARHPPQFPTALHNSPSPAGQAYT